LAAESEVDEALNQIWRYRVDGAIVAARLSDAQLSEFADRGVPVVLYNRIGGEVAAASVRCDSLSGEAELVDALVSSGHQSFGIIAGPFDSYVSQERVSAASARLEKHGFVAPIVPGNFDYASGEAGLKELVRMTSGALEAVICANDMLAIGAIDCARFELNMRVPEDISIVGFDGVGPARWRGYQLTTIRQPVRRMTDAAVAMLIDRIEHADLPPEQRVFAGEFLAGNSARTRK
jgi:DNA-binding LacI/PurR family transcriptional regulator